MSYEFYEIEKKAPIAWVYLNRPEKKNAMNPPAWTEIIPVFDDLDKIEKDQKGGTKLKLLKKNCALQEGFSSIEKCGKPVIIAIHGHCIGAGLDMATKDVLNYGIGKSVDDGLKYVATISTNIVPSNDLMEAVAAFSQKRKPKFTGK